MKKYSKIYRLFYSIGIIGIAIQQLVVGAFMPVIVPPTPVWLSACTGCVWAVSVWLIAGGIALFFDKYARRAALLLGTVFLLLFITLHLPFQLQNNLHFLGGWGNAIKILALSGGAFVIAASSAQTNDSKFVSVLAKLIPVGRFLFAIDILLSGVMHFLYMPFVVMLVPAWVPWPTFWGYLSGAGLIAGGAAIILNFQQRLAANLLGIIIFIWLITLHIPRAIADPYTGNGNEIVSVFEALAFSGIAFLIAVNAGRKAA